MNEEFDVRKDVRRSSVLVFLFLSLSLGTHLAHAQQCADTFKTPSKDYEQQAQLSDKDIALFLSSESHARAGEKNAMILAFFKANETRLSIPGAITLIRGLQTAGQPSMHQQFFPHMPKDYAQRTIVDALLVRHQETLSKDDLTYLIELVENASYRSSLTAKYL